MMRDKAGDSSVIRAPSAAASRFRSAACQVASVILSQTKRIFQKLVLPSSRDCLFWSSIRTNQIPARSFGTCRSSLIDRAFRVVNACCPATLGDWFWKLDCSVWPWLFSPGRLVVCRSGIDCGGEESFAVKPLKNVLSHVARSTVASETRRAQITADPLGSAPRCTAFRCVQI